MILSERQPRLFGVLNWLLRRFRSFEQGKRKVNSQTIQKGLYRHFKGGIYEVLGTAEVVDTDSVFVVYRRDGSSELVLRPYDEFIGTVIRDGKAHKRFQPLSEISPYVASNPERCEAAQA